MTSERSILERMVTAVEKVRERLRRVASVLGAAKVPYAVVGGNAVAAWVATVDDSAVRNTQDVDILIARADFAPAKAALESGGFVYRHTAGLDIFLDGPGARPRDAVHVVFANEFVRPHEAAANPDVQESTDLGPFRVINLDALVRIKLTAFRDKDRMHLRDLIDVGLVSGDDLDNLAPTLRVRLQQLLDTPDG